MKKISGVVVTVTGAALALSALSLAATKYNLSSAHDLSRFLGALCVSVLLLAAGIAMLVNRKPSENRKEPRRSRGNSRRG